MSNMSSIFPIACFSCGKRVAALLDMYNRLCDEKHPTPFKVMGIKRYCCKRMFIGYIQSQTPHKYL